MRRKPYRKFANGGDPEDPYDPSYNWGAAHPYSLRQTQTSAPNAPVLAQAEPVRNTQLPAANTGTWDSWGGDGTPPPSPVNNGQPAPMLQDPNQSAPMPSIASLATPAAGKQRNNVFSKFGDIVPYMSNIANSFRRAPLPQAPGSITPITAQHVTGENQMAEADRAMRGQNAAADRNLDENTAAAVKTGNMVQGIRAKNAVSEWADNTNAGFRQQASQINASIQGQNVGMMNQYHDQQTAAQIANQNNQSANMSNAADKYISQENSKSAAQLERDKWQAYQPMFKSSGVADRAFDKNSDYAKYVQRNDPERYKGMYGTYAAGGEMEVPKRPDQRAIAESTSVPRVQIPERGQPVYQNTASMHGVPAGHEESAPDTRSYLSDSRAKERGAMGWDYMKKVTSAGQFAPFPAVSIPSAAISTAMGAYDTYESLQAGDNTNAGLNALGAIPFPGAKAIKGLAVGTKAAAKLSRVAALAGTAGIAGAGADWTNNYGNQKANGGYITRRRAFA